MTLDWQLLLHDGAILAVLASVWVMGSLRYNPRLFLRHYPKEIREAAAPLTHAERKASKLVGLPFLALLIGLPIWSTLSFASAHPDALFADQVVHGFGVSMVFNLVDFVVLDLLWLGVLRPRWAMIPNTEHVTFRFNTADHVRGFVVGTVVALVVGLIAGGIAALT
ncbi:conserved membrane hypothetical protein [uncultured Defluviicoccus sp.]|uniref:Uncharacterized protein n=1 Tax=metagenome TaxID=256318 RepID=A0A380T7E6_9ZZZZ|nr:conserved membrane hypothetical protein [uncultured Defluviicoccus sp.]